MYTVAYKSAFTDPVDELLLDSFGLDPLLDLAACYEAMPELDSRLSAAADEWAKISHYESLSECLEKDISSSSDTFYIIQSVVGDDETTTTDSAAFGPLIIIAGTIVSGIKLSQKDTGISAEIGNYAEGWTLIPPTSDSSFEAVNRRHSREGVPIVLDPVKLKLVSAVRKQSLLELDLESKLSAVHKAADWVHRLWFTYDYHQMMIILATNIFDFRDARSFPYLFATEGGCGGLPPYGNVDTAISALFAFHKGKARRTVLGIAHESVACHFGRMKPNETFFIRSSHIAQLGDKAWEKYNRVYRHLLKDSDAVIAKNTLAILADKEALPPELLERGAEVSPDDINVGVAISHLREDNFLMTELDVKMSLENAKKIEALGGTRPLRDVLKEIEDEKTKFKSNSWKVLGEIAGRFIDKDFITEDALGNMPSLEDHYRASSILMNYYSLRAEHYAHFTSFSYTDAIRVFRTADVLDYVRRKNNVLRADIVKQVDPKMALAFPLDLQAERLRKERIFKWLDSEDLQSLLDSPLPQGIGPDDSRIFNSIVSNMEAFEEGTKTSPGVLVVILFSSDRKLARKLAAFAKKRCPEKPWLFFSVEVNQYIGLCLSAIREQQDHPRPIDPNRDVMFHNYITRTASPMPRNVMNSVRDTIRGMGKTYYRPLLEFDYPNLERALEPATYIAATNSVELRGGGFLRAPTLIQMPKRSSWACLEMDRLFSLSDFRRDIKFEYAVDRMPKKVYINRPLRPEFFRAVSSWQRRVK
jgi:hypothetical protein